MKRTTREQRLKALCEKCKRRSTLKTLEKYDGLCPRCHSSAHLPPYDEAGAFAIIREVMHQNGRHDKAFQALRAGMQPPPFARRWAPAHEWSSWDTHDLWTRTWRWVA